MKIKEKALEIFFPAMYLCMATALITIWFGDMLSLSDYFFRLIPTFLIIGFGALITWLVLVIREFLNIAKAKK